MVNKTNSENGHRVFSIFKKKQGNNGVGFLFSRVFFLNVENTKCPFLELVLFCLEVLRLLWFLKNASLCNALSTGVCGQFETESSST